VRVLVGELHCDAATKRVAHDGDTVDPEHGEQVAHAVRESRQGVIGTRFVGLAVAQQIRGDDRKPLGEFGVHRLPCRGVVAHAVDQQQGRAGPGNPERAAVAMDRAELQRRRRDVPYRPQVGP